MIIQKHKHVEERKALIKAIIFFAILLGGGAGLLIWAAQSEQSAVAESIRNTIGIKAPELNTPPPPVEKVVAEPPPMPTAVVKVEPAPQPNLLPEISFSDLSKSKYLWPDTLNLKASKQVTIRYQSQVFGYMEFNAGAEIKVHALRAPAEVDCSINGNFISLSINKTNFTDWFTQNHSERYRLKPMTEAIGAEATKSYSLDSAEGDATFWAEMRIWCHRNYDSISLEIGEEQLTFNWLPREDAPINFQMEAREIARTYLLIRSRLGGNENYAACKILHPTTGEQLGSSSIFIPRL